MAAMLAEQLDFNHFNRDFPMNSRDQLLETLRTFAGQYFVERGFGPPEKLLVDGNTVVRVADYTGIGKVDLPGFGNAGAAEQDHGRIDAAFGENHFRLQQFKLQADGTQFLPAEEVLVVEGKTVGRGAGLRRIGNLAGFLDVLG